MLTSITWEIFFTAILMMVCGYYAITSLLLYHKEIKQWVSRKKSFSIKGADQPADEVRLTTLMGDIVKQEFEHTPRTSFIDAIELSVGQTEDVAEVIQSSPVIDNNDLKINSVTDLIQDVKELTQLIIECRTDKEESQSLFHALLIKYFHLVNTPYQDVISHYICESAKNQFSFPLTFHEVTTWWQFESSPSK